MGGGVDSCVRAPGVGDRAPAFDLPCTRCEDTASGRVALGPLQGSWVVIVFYPRDFSFVCPTELISFSARKDEFDRRSCRLVAISVDPIRLHEEWTSTEPSRGGVGRLRLPLASDADGAVARAYGAYVESKRVAGRQLFIVDPEGVIQYSLAQSLSIGRSVDETLRVLDALQSGRLCPADSRGGTGVELDLEPGHVLGHFRILAKIGEGSYSQVFRAKDLWLERDVALKVLRPGRNVDRTRVFDEARIAASLNHPNICTIYSVSEDVGLPLIAMEFVDGTTLAARLRKGPLPPSQLSTVARGIASGLASSHDRAIVHGDLKPKAWPSSRTWPCPASRARRAAPRTPPDAGSASAAPSATCLPRSSSTGRCAPRATSSSSA
jgi:alkyl hydroperoxide reductase subunit AhpC